MKKVKKAFSLIEVIFVLVILGIVASISSQIIVQVYENYITQRAVYNTSTKTELVATQIVNRLTYAIYGTTIAKDTTNTGTVEGTNWIKLENIPATDNNFTTIEWIGYDNDSFSAGAIPYWNGVANYETATGASFVSPASNFNNVATIMSNLSKKGATSKVNLSSSKPAGLLFVQKDNFYKYDVAKNGVKYDPSCMGLIEANNTSCIFRVSRNNDTNLSFENDVNTLAQLPKIVTERYKLAWSAYALVPELNAEGLHDLFLYYNYQPWNGEMYNSSNSEKSLLMKNVSVLKFTENGGVIQLKLCATENIGTDYNISACKEKAIIK